MSQDLKRGAEQAFGEDSSDHKKTGSKRRKERRKQIQKDALPGKQQTIERVAHSTNNTPNTKISRGSVAKSTPTSSRAQDGDRVKAGGVQQKQQTRPAVNGQEETKKHKSHATTANETQQESSQVQTSSSSPADTTQKAKALPKRGKMNNERSPRQDRKSGAENQHTGAQSEKAVSKRRKHKKSRGNDASKWTLTQPIGGTFIDHDPVLTPDEQHLILATKKEIQVYATETSLLVRAIQATNSSPIVSYALLPTVSKHLVVGFENGTIKKFDWTTGTRIWTKRLDNHIISITPTSSGEQGDSFLVVIELEDKQTAITSLTVDYNGEQTGLRPMLSKGTLTGRVCFSAELGTAVVCTQTSILIGRLEGEGVEAVLVWEELSVADKIVCFDARISSPSQKQPNSKKSSKSATVTVAVGLKSGEIHIYNDVLNKRSETSTLIPQRLHWHRSAPRTLKFSPESRYLVSGGNETVLVMWQLDTNQKQVLPHLTSAILDISISAQGSSYVLRLADNSVMVISTSDLKPSANVSGLAVDVSSIPFLPDSAIPAVLHPQHPSQMLLAYSSQSLTPGLKPSEKSLNMLQTYDISSGLQLSRQALARNLASTINIGGNGQQIHEPDVTHLDVTYDGKWLVTVDQWSPNSDDLDQLYLSRGDTLNRALQTETFLRFWSSPTNPSATSSPTSWELNTRIDQPVSSSIDNTAAPAILALATSPTRTQVVTADTSHDLKFYTPKARIKGGLPVRDATGAPLFSWTCDHTIPFPPSSTSSPKTATLSYSPDGSILAVSFSTTSTSSSRVHIIDPRTATQIANLPDIVTAGPSHLAFYGQYLIALSSKLAVLDLVTTQSSMVFDIHADFPNSRFDAAKSHFAINERAGILAVCLSERDVKKASHVILLDVEVDSTVGVKITHKERIGEGVKILLAEKDGMGFVIADGEGRCRRLARPGFSVLGDMFVDVNVDARMNLGAVGKGGGQLENIFGSMSKKGNKAVMVPQTTNVNGGAKRTLQDVFRFERSGDVPGVGELFSRVVEVVGGVGT